MVQQVQVGGIDPQRVTNLSEGLNGLLGAASKGLETYNTIGETAAKLAFRDKSLEVQDAITGMKSALYADPNNTELWKQTNSAIDSLTSEMVADREQFVNHKDAYDTYNALATEQGVNIRAAITPMISSGLYSATVHNTKLGTQLAASTLGAGATSANIQTEVDINTAIGTGLDVPKEFLVQNLGAFESDFNSNPAFLVKSFYVDKATGTINQRNGDTALINAYYSAFAKVNKDGVLDATNSYVTEEHLQDISRSIAKVHALFKTPEGTKHSSELASSLDNANTIASQLKSGVIDRVTAMTSIKTAKDNIDTYFDFGSDGQKNSANDVKVNLVAADTLFTYATGQIDTALSKGAKGLRTLLLNGTKKYKYSAMGVNREEDIQPSVYKNILNNEVVALDDKLYGKDGKVNYDALSSIIAVTNNAGTDVKSGKLDAAINGVFNSGVSSSQSVDEFLNDINVARYALKHKTTPYDVINKEQLNSIYLDDLERAVKAKVGSKNPAVDITNAKAMIGTKSRGLSSIATVTEQLAPVGISYVKTNIDKLQTIGKFGTATNFTVNDVNMKTWANRNIKYSGYQTTDRDAFKAGFTDVITNEQNSYFFQSSATPTAKIKYVPNAYDDAFVPVSADKFNMAIANKLPYEALKNVLVWDSFKDENGKTVRMVDLSQENIETNVMDGTKGSIVEVSVYNKNRKKSDAPIILPIRIPSTEFNKYGKVPLTKGIQRWFNQ